MVHVARIRADDRQLRGRRNQAQRPLHPAAAADWVDVVQRARPGGRGDQRLRHGSEGWEHRWAWGCLRDPVPHGHPGALPGGAAVDALTAVSARARGRVARRPARRPLRQANRRAQPVLAALCGGGELETRQLSQEVGRRAGVQESLALHVIPVNHPPTAKKAQGNSRSPDQPTKTKRSRFSQSSTRSKGLRSWFCPIAIVILTIVFFY